MRSVAILVSALKFATKPAIPTCDVTPASNDIDRDNCEENVVEEVVQKPSPSKTLGNRNKLHPTLFWDPPDLVYLDPLTETHFAAHCKDFKTRPVDGKYFFDPYLGLVLSAGEHELSVTFVPTKAHKYHSVTATRTVTVKKRRPVIEWDFPFQEIVFGTALGEEHFSVRSDVPGGTFTFSHQPERVLSIGVHKMSVEYEPSPEHRGNYTRGYAHVAFEVVGTTVPIVWKIPFSAESYAFFTKHVQNMVEANTFVVDTPPPVLPAREDPDLARRGAQRRRKKEQAAEEARAAKQAADAAAAKEVKEFTPDSVVVVTALPSRRRSSAFTAGAPIIHPEPLPEWLFRAEAVFFDPDRQESVYVDGQFVYDPPEGAVLPAGEYTIQLTFIPADRARYRITKDSRRVSILKSPVPLEWPLSIGMTEGETLDERHLNCRNLLDLPGTYHYEPAFGAALSEGRHTLRVRFDPEDGVNYHSAATSVPFQVRPKRQPQIYWATPPDIVHPFPLSKLQLNAACRGGAFYRGTFEYEPSFGTVLDAGVHTLKATFRPELPTVAEVVTTVQLVVHQGISRLVWNTPEPLMDGQGLYDDVLTCRCTNLTGGTFIYRPPKGTTLSEGPHKLTVRYIPDDPNFMEAETSILMQVRPKPKRRSKYYVS